MLAMVGARGFALAANRASGGVYSGADGIFVGGVPLLQRAGAMGAWSVRPLAKLNDELSTRYRLPIDIAAKANALSLIAHALNRGDLAMAAIAAVQMQLPDPPLSKAMESHDQLVRRAAALHRSGLLKWEWDPLKHPRLGTAPNPGWFASTGGDDARAQESRVTPRPQLAVLPSDMMIPLCLASSGGLGDCLGGTGGVSGEVRGGDSDFVEPRGSSESSGYGVPRPPATAEPAEASDATAPPATAQVGARSTETISPAPVAAAASANQSTPPKIGSFPVPDNLIYGTTDFGNYAHNKMAELLKELYPDVKFTFRVGRGQKGIDVDVPENTRVPPMLRGKSLELKPQTPSGERRFYQQQERWGVPVEPLTYDQDGNIYYGFR